MGMPETLLLVMLVIANNKLFTLLSIVDRSWITIKMLVNEIKCNSL